MHAFANLDWDIHGLWVSMIVCIKEGQSVQDTSYRPPQASLHTTWSKRTCHHCSYMYISVWIWWKIHQLHVCQTRHTYSICPGHYVIGHIPKLHYRKILPQNIPNFIFILAITYHSLNYFGMMSLYHTCVFFYSYLINKKLWHVLDLIQFNPSGGF